MRTVIAVLAAALMVASCASTGTSPSPPPASEAPVASPSGPKPSNGPSAAPTASPTASTDGEPRWAEAGLLSVGRFRPHALLLGDGRVLVVGNDDAACVRPDSTVVEVWDPGSSTWAEARSLPKPRAEFAAVVLADGRAMVVGGINQGIIEEWGGNEGGHSAYSSGYLYDPTDPGAGWSRTALLPTARTAPAAAALSDGRVLIVGGYYLEAASAGLEPGFGVVLAAYPGPRAGSLSGSSRLANVDPPAEAPTFATAELYDPQLDTWSSTGAMRFARVGAQAATLADGRVLVFGSSRPMWWNYAQAQVDERAYETAELYDPARGTFTLTGALPPIDWSPLTSLGSAELDRMSWVEADGTLVALRGGGALLVGRATRRYTLDRSGNYEHEGYVVQTLRFDPVSATWSEIDRTVGVREDAWPLQPWRTAIPGRSTKAGYVTVLRDGRVLVAGGVDVIQGGAVSTTTIYDAATDTWTAGPQLPDVRAWGTAVALPDGGVLLVGGRATIEPSSHGCGGSTGLATALRWTPAP